MDELYIGKPYFHGVTADLIKEILVPISYAPEEIDDEELERPSEPIKSAGSKGVEKASVSIESKSEPKMETIEQAIKRRMANFYNKRRASGDFRPYGPHDLLPVYLKVFGINERESYDSNFTLRMRKCGTDWRNEESAGEIVGKEGKKGEEGASKNVRREKRK
ncbi:uncharacterized protein RSE6_12609 [Rhynchosporium secalis]|uniref:Uncharacterized protein n=1 Tax=Rhynchosporium secalis TaxID=38038 RepID=A0A1E1MQZ2_RHYSE|nr:uncharacterized protein RSE6_12609 [Rhynchosporium secalis]